MMNINNIYKIIILFVYFIYISYIDIVIYVSVKHLLRFIMALKPLRRDYRITDAELCSFTFNLINSMTRDDTEFTARGVTSVERTALETLADAFQSFPNDEFYRADVSIAVQAKEDLRKSMEIQIRDIVQCAIIKWGDGSPQYRKFAVSKISKANDMTFLTIARQVVLVGTDYLTDLTDVGLTQTMLDDLEDDTDSFHSALISIYNAEELRDIKTQERAQKGNEIYSLVKKYCRIGKIIWDDVDEAKYNDYVIYPKSSHQLSKPQNLTAEYMAGSPAVVHLGWDAVTDAEYYEVYVSIRDIGAPSGDFNHLDTFTDNFADVPPVNNKRNYYKIKARNAESTSDYSDEAYVDVEIT